MPPRNPMPETGARETRVLPSEAPQTPQPRASPLPHCSLWDAPWRVTWNSQPPPDQSAWGAAGGQRLGQAAPVVLLPRQQRAEASRQRREVLWSASPPPPRLGGSRNRARSSEGRQSASE